MPIMFRTVLHTTPTIVPIRGIQLINPGIEAYAALLNVASKPAFVGLTKSVTRRCSIPAQTNNRIGVSIAMTMRLTKSPAIPPIKAAAAPETPFCAPPTNDRGMLMMPPRSVEIRKQITAKIRGLAKSPRRRMPAKKRAGCVSTPVTVLTKARTGSL